MSRRFNNGSKAKTWWEQYAVSSWINPDSCNLTRHSASNKNVWMKELLAIMLFWMAPQTPGASFDVASVKSNNANNGIVSIGSDPGGRFTASGMTLTPLIANAYRIREFQIAGGPAWIGTDRFDIEAKANWDA